MFDTVATIAQQPALTPSIIVILFILLTIYNTFNKSDFTENFRKKQAKETADSNSALMQKLEEKTKKSVSVSKRVKRETICRQAGFPMKYHQYLVLEVVSSVVLAFLCLVIIRNEFLAVECLLIGRMVPGQFMMAVRNKRIAKLENQIGPFLEMIKQRYVNSINMTKSLKLTKDEFKGMEPMYSELVETVGEIDAGVPPKKALEEMAARCENKFLKRFVEYYKIADEIGTDEARKNLLEQAVLQYREDLEMKQTMKKELNEPVKDSYIMIITVPLFSCFGFIAVDGYADFLFNKTEGKLMVAGVTGIVLGIIWIINNKIGAPLK